MRPRALFKWVGGKSHAIPRVVPLIRAHLAATGGKLISPFYGSGALERASEIPALRQIGADANPDLRCLCHELARSPAQVHAALQYLASFFGQDARAYRCVRGAAPSTDAHRAARFLYLQTFAFNGIWRVNSAGQHNVDPDPARLAKANALPTLVQLEDFARYLPRSWDFHGDWTEATARAGRGDLVVCDPPYLDTARGYTADGFGAHAHEVLAAKLKALAFAGVGIIAFNSTAARHLYGWARVEVTVRSGRISSKGSGRGEVEELLVTAGLQGAAGWRAA